MMKFKPKDIDCNDEDSLRPRALGITLTVPGEDLSGPPMDGEQYLRRVFAEAVKCPPVVAVDVKKIEKEYPLPKMREIKTCNSELLPSKDWQLSAMSDFSRLRLKIDALREKMEGDPTLIALTNALPDSDTEWLKVVLQQEPDVLARPVGPSTRLCLAVPQLKLWDLLPLFVDWLDDGDVSVTVGCRWLFCLLACLDSAMPPQAYAALRNIARTLINCRAQIESLEAEELPHVNLLVCIIGRYFNQEDLADPYL